jgi:hypothetical protein
MSLPACQWLVDVDGDHVNEGDVLQAPTFHGRSGVPGSCGVSRWFAGCMSDDPATIQPISWLITRASRVPVAGRNT